MNNMDESTSYNPAQNADIDGQTQGFEADVETAVLAQTDDPQIMPLADPGAGDVEKTYQAYP